MAFNRVIVPVVVLAVMSVLCMEKCYGMTPVTQNDTFAAMRLVSNVPTDTNKGRVDIMTIFGVWGSICPTGWSSAISTNIVHAICAMLGYSNGGTQIANIFGDGNKNFLIENITCPSGATSLYQCLQYFAKKCGAQDKELAVQCNADPKGSNYVILGQVVSNTGPGLAPAGPSQNPVYLTGLTSTTCTPPTNVRLFGGDLINATIGNGYVQVLANNQWGFYCGDSWTQADARVVCKQLCYITQGFDPLPGVIALSVPDPQNITFISNNLNCIGNESRIEDCPTVSSPTACRQSSLLAGVQCRPDCCEDTITAPDVNCSIGSLIANFPPSTSNMLFVSNVPRQCYTLITSATGTTANFTTTSDCGTQLHDNSSHITYTISVKITYTIGTEVIRDYRIVNYDLVCSVAKSISVVNRLQPTEDDESLTVNKNSNFSVSMNFYTNCNFTDVSSSDAQYYFVEVGQWLDVGLSINNYDSRTKLVITDCDSFPVVPYNAYTPVLKLIQDKCPVDTTLTMYSLDNRREGFQVKAYMFAGYSMVYIRCSINICLATSTAPECDRNCNKPHNGRKRRDASAVSDYYSAAIDTKPIILFNPNTIDMSKLSPSSQSQDSSGQQSSDAVSSTTMAPQLQPKQPVKQAEQPEDIDSTTVERQPLASGHQGDAVELVGHNPNRAISNHMSKVLYAILFLCTFAAMLP